MSPDEKDTQETSIVSGEVVQASVESIDRVPQEWPEVIDRSVNRVADVLQERQQLQHEETKSTLAIDKGLLLILGIALLATLIFTFYMLATNRLQPVSQVLYPILTALIGFMSGYFAGSGRKGLRRK